MGAPDSLSACARVTVRTPTPIVNNLHPIRRDAGLVTGKREGRSVLYARTSLGDALATQQTAER
jgi:hypothetical protein